MVPGTHFFGWAWRSALALIAMFFALLPSAHENEREPDQGLPYCGLQRWEDDRCFMHCLTPQDTTEHYYCPTLGKAYRDLEPPTENREVIQIGYGCYRTPEEFYPSYSITVRENGQRVWLGRVLCDGNFPISDPVMPMVRIDDTTVTEGPNGQAEFMVSLSQTTDSPVTVEYETSGVTAEPGKDFQDKNGMLTIEPGQRDATIMVMVYDDEEAEDPETFMVLLSNPTNADIEDGDGVGTITDNDEANPPPLPTLSINDASAVEGPNASVVFTVTLSATSTDDVTVTYGTSGGTALAGSDYTTTASTLTIDAGQQTGTIEVPVLDDSAVEPTETFTMTLSNPTNATIQDGQGTGTITNDDVPLPTLSINDASAVEGPNASVVFTVTLSATSSDDVTVSYATSDGTAASGSDYTTTSGTLTIDAGQQTGAIEVPVLDDSAVEPTETFSMTLSNPSNATIRDGQGTGTITNDDVPLPTLSINDVAATEGPGATAVFTVTLSATSTDDVTVSYATSDGTALAGSDYTTTSGTLTIDAGQQTGAIEVPVLDDSTVEQTESFTVTLSSPTNATIQDAQGTGTIIDDDGTEPQLPTLSINDVNVAEGQNATAVFTVTLSASSDDAVTVSYATSDDTASAGTDYASATSMLTIDAGQPTGTIRIAVLNDTTVEQAETFKVTLSGATNATIRDGEGIGTITDDDSTVVPPRLPTLSINDATVREGSDAEALFTVTLSADSDQSVSVAYSTSDVTALAGTDYASANDTLTIDAGQRTGTIRITVLDDAAVEQSETFKVTLSGATNATIQEGEGIGTITDDDSTRQPGQPTLSINDVTVTEADNAAAVFTVTLSEVSDDTVTVAYATSDGTASAGTDYTTTSGTLTIDSGQRTGTIRVAVLNDTTVEQAETFKVTLSGATNATIEGGEGTGTIEDDDEARPPRANELSIGDAVVTEGPRAEAIFTVTLSTPNAAPVTVTYATRAVTAQAGVDYTAVKAQLTIGAGAATGTIRIRVLDDDEQEQDETFHVKLSDAVNATIADDEGLGTIKDDDGATPPPGPPELTVGDVVVTEGTDATAEFAVTLSMASESAVVVEYATNNGTATAGEDYTSTRGTLLIPVGAVEGTVAVPILDDDQVESDESFTLDLSKPVNATIDDGEGTATIKDDDEAPPTLSVSDATATEGDDAAVFTVTLSAASTRAVTVAYATTDGTATAGEDYASTGGTLTVPAGDTTGEIRVPVLDDDEVEEAETFTLTLSDPTNATIDDDEGIGTIADDDEAPPTLSVGDATATEGDDAAVFTVTLSAASTRAVTVAYATTDGTAKAGEDYASTGGTLTVPAGDTTGEIRVPVLDDDEVEEAESFTLTLSDPTNATIDDDEGIGTIADDDDDVPPPELPTLSVDDPTVTEGEAAAVFTVTLSSASDEAVTAAFATSDGTATAGEDYTSTNGTLTIPAGDLTGEISVPVLDDDDVEEAETFNLTLSDATNATLDDGRGEATIEDDDEPPPPELPTLSVDDPTVTEGEAAAVFTVTLSSAGDEAVTAAYTTSDGTATAGEDYTSASGTLTIPAGDTTGEISVPVLDDDEVEEAESFNLTLSDATNATLDDGQGEATIEDDDEPPPPELPTLSVDDPTATEGEAAAVFTVTLSSASDEAVTAAYTTSDGTATAGEDYTSASGTLTIPAGDTTGEISVPVLDDDEVEEAETFNLTLSDATNATLDDGRGEATIEDDDEPPPPELPTLSVDDPTATEGEAAAVFTVTLSPAGDEAVTAAYTTSDGTATAGEDYTSASGTLTIPAGDTTGEIRVPVLDDDEVEEAESFTLTLSDPTNATIDDDEGIGTIADDDEAPPTLSVGDATATEGDDAAVFTVTLSAASTRAVTVAYATTDGTATAGEDYASTSGTLTVPAGDTTGEIRVPVLDDDEVEEAETFTLTLSDPTNATIDDGEGIGTIADDDDDVPPPELPTLSVDDPTVTEGEAAAVFTVTLSSAGDEAVTAAYTTSDGTATAGEDYTSASGTLTIPAGDTTGEISVPVLDDDDVEEAETFNLTLSDATNASLDDGQGEATIEDDDEPPPPELPTLSVDDPTVTEGEAAAVFTVTLSSAGDEAVTVAYTTSDGTATAGEDYTSTNGTLTIPAGDLTGEISVPVLDDDDVEEAETFNLTLSDATNATLDDGRGEATIEDDDEPPPPELPTLSVDDPTATEGEAAAVFTVTLSSAGDEAVTAAYTTSDGTATAGEDYTSTSGTLTIPAGDTTGEISVPVLDDDDVEEAETFNLTLSDATNATLDDGQGEATIEDDDEPPPPLPAFTINDTTVAEAVGAEAVFVVSLSATSEDDVTVDYETADGTALAGDDYTAASGTLTISAGEPSGEISVSIVNDDVAEETESFTVALSNAANATIDDGEGTASITDADMPPPPTRGIVGAAKELLRVEAIDTTEHRAVFRLRIANVGDGLANDVQLTDDLAGAFPPPALIRVESVSADNGDLTLNASFDGIDDVNLLAGEDALEAGATATLDVSVSVSPNGASGPFANQAVAVSTDDAGTTTNDLSDNGTDPDANGNGDPSDPGEDDATPVTFPASLIGTVFADNDVDGTADENEPRLAGWRIEAVGEDGVLITSALTGSAGEYGFAGLEPGTLTIRFRHAESNVAWQETPVTVAVNGVSRVDYGAAPGGRLYDSIGRELIPGVVVSLVAGDGVALPGGCLLDGQQGQRTGSDGAYRFVLVHGSHASCPQATATYRVRIDAAPSGYAVRPSLLIPPAGDALNVAACEGDSDPEAPCVVSPHAFPASAMPAPTYYYEWAIAGGDGTVVHNHVPLDGVTPGTLDSLASISKAATESTAVQGDLVGYNVRLANDANVPLRSVQVADRAPGGFSHVATAAVLVTAGPDRRLDTADDDIETLATTLGETTLFGPFDVPVGDSVIVRYLMRVGLNATPGTYVNTAMPLIAGERIGNVATASVDVIADPILGKTTLIGKVFDDRDGNGRQDAGESGIPGVRIASVEGLTVETDAYGRYHLAGLDVGDPDRGSNFIVKLDTQTLPGDAEVVGENPRVIRLTSALMSKVNFPVRLPERPLVERPVAEQIVVDVRRHPFGRVDSVRFDSGESHIPDSYIERWREMLATYRGESSMRVRFTGHTDSQPLSARSQRIHGDNQGLSEARARQVAEFVVAELGLATERIETEGHADRLPIASNGTPEGRALNRRVDVAFLFDAAGEREGSGESVAGTERKSETRYAREVAAIEPTRFATAAPGMTTDQVGQLDRALAPFADVEVLSATVIGHADEASDGRALGEADSMNELSRARAQGVAERVAAALGIDASLVEVGARGSREPVADSGSEFGRILNRRADIQISYQRPVETHTERRIAIEPAQLAPVAGVLGGGRVWLTEDVTTRRPRLDVLALNEIAVDDDGRMTAPVKFAAYGNYSEWVSRYRLTVYAETDTDLVRPLAVLSTTDLATGSAFEFLDKDIEFEPGTRLAYVLTAEDNAGRLDTTHARLVDVVESGAVAPERDPAAIQGQSNLAIQTIVIHGSRLRVHGDGFRPGEAIGVDGQALEADGKGRFVTEMHAPPGVMQIEITGVSHGFNWKETLTAEIDENYTFVVGLANLTVGGRSVSGRLEPVAPEDDFDESVHLDGRLALYVKAKIRGRYLVTAQLDTTQDDLENLGDNLKRRDPRRLFRQLDPNRYYPVYGDDSTTVSDVDTVGAYYLRVDWDRNQLLLGNFNTGMTDTETMQYNRSLHGARVIHKSPESTRYGDSRRSVTAFASEAQTAAAHVSYRGTGGSLYYLKHTDIVEGSEKVWVEVRHRDSRQILERREYMRGRDYEIDPLQGRIVLSRPLLPVFGERAEAIVRSRPLGGDDVHLLVDYEYIVEGLTGEKVTYGARGKAWFGDHVAVGASKVVDERDGGDFELTGVDVTLKAGRGTYLNIESAFTEAVRNAVVFDSDDGGISFRSRSDTESSPPTDGDSLAVEGRVNLAEMSDKLTGNVRAWWKDRDAGFSSGRFDSPSDTTESGFDANIDLSEDATFRASYSERDEGALGSGGIGRVQTDVRVSKVTVGGELRHESVERSTTPLRDGVDGDALQAGVRVGYDLDKRRTVYGLLQSSLDTSGNIADNDLVAMGLNARVSQHMAVSVEASDGDRGSALSGGFEYSPASHLSFGLGTGVGSGATTQFSGNYLVAEGHELYGSYTVDPDRTFGERSLLTLGQRRDVGNRFGIFTESHFGENDRHAGFSHTFGLDYETNHGWILSGLLTRANNETSAAAPFERDALSLGAAVRRDGYRFSSKLEHRTESGPGVERSQIVASSSLTRIADPSRRWLAGLKIAVTQDEISHRNDARFVELDLGHAYRPVDNDRWNTLAKVGYFQDLVSTGQRADRPDQRVGIFSLDALRRIGNDWELGTKVAFKEGRMRASRVAGGWHDTGVALGIVRAQRHVLKRWDAFAEYRYQFDRHADSERHGALLGTYRQLGDNAKIGIGFNFTDFSDDIRDAGSNHRGWFIDLVGKF